MELTDVMGQAISEFGPTAENEHYALDAALAAAEQLLASIGIGRSVINWQELRNVAMSVWDQYCEQALATEFVVTSLCRNDLVEMGATEAQARILSDADMRAIAKKMEDGYVGIGSFWPDLAEAVNERLAVKGLAPIAFSVSPDD